MSKLYQKKKKAKKKIPKFIVSQYKTVQKMYSAESNSEEFREVFYTIYNTGKTVVNIGCCIPTGSCMPISS